ncbi:MAG TPA: sugar phosphate isomerase/epimerase [Blastocatellia bacterium]|nr:sugar phosphate isomerase/epimerase [Blastocatellia bacterium]
MIDRRQFMTHMAGGLLGGLCVARNGLGGFLKDSSNKIGLQLYTVRRELQKDFEGTLARVAGIGYREVEFAGYYERTPQQVKAILDKNNLTSPSAHTQLQGLRQGLDKLLDAAHVIGHRYLVLAYLSADERKTLDDYKGVIETLNQAGETCRRAGVQLAYHNHDFEFPPIGGVVPYDLMLKETRPDLVKMELDLYWITKAGQSASQYFAANRGRFALVHVKDMDNTPKRFFTEVGRGVIDFKQLLPQAKRAGVKHFFVEQDETPGSPLDSIKISYDYLHNLRW